MLHTSTMLNAVSLRSLHWATKYIVMTINIYLKYNKRYSTGMWNRQRESNLRHLIWLSRTRIHGSIQDADFSIIQLPWTSFQWYRISHSQVTKRKDDCEWTEKCFGVSYFTLMFPLVINHSINVSLCVGNCVVLVS